jgi:Arc/MetJ-type ribon-helix-helix transcriptional regulator
MVIELQPEIEALLEADMATGHFASREEYLARAVKDFHERQAQAQEFIEEQMALLEQAWQESERGEVISLEEMEADLQQLKAEWDRESPAR